MSLAIVGTAFGVGQAVAGLKVKASAGALTFLEATTISTSTGALTINAFTLAGEMTMNSSDYLVRDVDDSHTNIWGGTSQGGGNVQMRGEDNSSDPSSIAFFTRNAAKSSNIQRLRVGGAADTVLATWGSVTHTGIVLSGALDCAGNYIELLEMSAPGAGAANTVRIYAVIDGGTLTDLAAVFQDSTIDLFAQEV